MQDLAGHPNIVKAITASISEEGVVQDGASDEVRAARGKLRAVENRLKAILKGHSGEVSEMVRHLYPIALCSNYRLADKQLR